VEAEEERDRKEVAMFESRTLPRIPRAAVAELLRDVERYLAAVEVFRAEGCEPRWRAAD
jgi:hypothetical protein